MKTIFQSHELWEMVEHRYQIPTKKEEALTEAETKLLRENEVKDAGALDIIQRTVFD